MNRGIPNPSSPRDGNHLTESISTSGGPGRAATGQSRPGSSSVGGPEGNTALSLLQLPFLFLLLLAHSTRAAETGLLSHWGFISHRQQGSVIKAWQGGPDIIPSGSYRWADDPPPARIELAGDTERLLVAESPDKAQLPKQELTLEAWVRVDRVQPRAGIFSAAQDPADAAAGRGLFLGSQEDRFVFALATRGTPRLIRVTATKPYQAGHWHHVAATYDGRVQRLFLDGAAVGESTTASGPLLFATNSPVVIGAFQDADEFYRLAGALHEIRLFQRALPELEILDRYRQRQNEFPAPGPEPVRFRPIYGPFVDWRTRTEVIVTWETAESMPSVIEWTAPDGSHRRLSDAEPKQQHVVAVPNLVPNTEYTFRLIGPTQGDRSMLSRRYEFDSSFYYAPASLPTQAEAVSTEDAQAQGVARDLLDKAGVKQGWALILGAHDGRLALEFARQSSLKIVVAESDAATVQKVRRLLDRAGVYGTRVSVHHVTNDVLPYGTFMANLVTSESTLATGKPPRWSAAETYRVTRPEGGVVLLGTAGHTAASASPSIPPMWASWSSESPLASTPPDRHNGLWIRHVRERLEGAGEWSHQYGNADNTSTSMDELVKGDLQVSWWGDPGPRPMPDRGPRNPAPLSVRGRLFIQGDRIFFGLDAYNGSVLWTVAAPEVRRSNLPRDCSNMVAADDSLYVAHGQYCLDFDGQTGARKRRLAVPSEPSGPAFDWGYLAAVEHLLVGSRVKPDSRYLGDDGEWFEDDHVEQISRVTSESLFGLNRADGTHRWTYRGGVILNSTITIGDGMIFFVESRSPKALASPTGRLNPELLTDQHLVALDLRTGQRLWEKSQDLAQLRFMTYLVYSRNTVVITGTDKDKNFHTLAFNAPAPASKPGDVEPLATGGQLLWSESHKEDKGHHSGHLQHPVVVDGVFYSDQRSFDLATGKTLRTDLPERRGCGTMSAARHALFFRHHFHGMWDLASDKRSQFEGIRGGCWLGLVPAGGMLLAPESSAGCSCTHAIQTSVGYVPQAVARR
ncbi:MAG: PQQ-binding-like beta-propeller repeat protein [Verrucomicrobiales bacterium]|nr:PQQ-binding-like beta-propeller repeat protein [Verrucomicrobiales bacterium]